MRLSSVGLFVMKRMFLIELSVMTVLVLFCIYRSLRSKKEIAWPTACVLCAIVVPLLGNMVIAASSLGYGVKIVSSPTMTLNGENHDALCEKLGVDPSMQAVAVLLIGKADAGTDATSGATTRESLESKTSFW